jgi:hypothetical protein
LRKDVRTTYLGNYARATANDIAGALEDAGIVWWSKNPGTFTRVLFAEFGVRLFVDKARLDEAREIARRIVAKAEQGEAG